MSLSAFVPPKPLPIEKPIEKIEEVVEPEPTVEEPKPEPIVEKIIPKPLPPVIKKKIIKKKIVKKVLKPKAKKKKPKKKIVKKKILKKKSIKTKKIKKKKATSSVAKKSTKSYASPAKKNAFLSKVRAKINRNKMYPRIAQKRGMEGSVKVKFTILANGQVSNIQVKGKKVFLNSARSAIKKAFPISVKNVPLSLPTTVNLTLRYQLH
jgi:protein TonB